ncbi:MAG: hypothetical protein ACXW1D_00165 [Halobacteriota archaeon]
MKKFKFDKRIIIGTVCMVVMSPVILAGVVFRPIKLYFDAGMVIADEVGKGIIDYLDGDEE